MKRAGYEVEMASNGREALAAIRPRDYVAFLSYLPHDPATEAAAVRPRVAVASGPACWPRT